MNSKILLASFCLVFLAELGDKTQLTALAFSASSRSPWSVFVGTSLALILTTAIAVVFGEVLARYMPERLLHIASGVMFVLVGLVLLVNQARKAGAPAAAEGAGSERIEEAPNGSRGLVSGLILHQAIHFENELARDLREQAAKLDEGELRQSLLQIADEDARHAKTLAAIADGEEDNAAPPGGGQDGAGASRALPDTDEVRQAAPDILARLQAAGREAEDDPVRVAVRRQEAAAEFYIALARLTHLHSARDTLRWLSMEEIRHAQHLCSLINHSEQPDGTA